MEKLLIYAPGREFLMPYLRKELSGISLCGLEESDGAEMAVMVSSCDIYGAGPKEDVAETAPVDYNSEWAEAEAVFRKACADVPSVILRCPNIVGTGMTGFPASLAAMIWRGLFFHFPDNDARVSAVHASDVARLVAMIVAGGPTCAHDIYNVTDSADPSLHDFAEALAFRMKEKRISTLSTRPQQWIGRKIYGTRRYAEYTTTRTFSSSRLRGDYPSFVPVPVTEYLRTHVYDENSL